MGDFNPISAVSEMLTGDKAVAAATAGRAESGRLSAQQQKLLEEAVQRLKDMGVPSAEAQRIVLESPELVGLQEFRQLGPSEFGGIETDPRLRQAQMDALSQIEKFGGAGLTDSEKAQAFMMQREASGSEQARQKAILQNMAQRGVGGSGIELAAQLSSGQASAERRAMAQAQLAGQAQQRALQAISQGGQLAGQIRGQSFGEQAQQAGAQDAISRFNAQQRAQIEAANLGRQQNIEQQRAGAAQQQEIHNKALIQQEFQNRFGKEQAITGAITGQSTALGKEAQRAIDSAKAEAEARAAAGAATAELIGAGIGAASGGKKEDGGLVQPMVLPQNRYPVSPARAPKIYAHGGIHKYAGGGTPVPEDGQPLDESRIFAGEDFAGDRVDAKVNSGEMVLNLEQQQRLMDLLKGYRDLAGLGDEDIIEASDPQIEDLNYNNYGGEGERIPSEVSADIVGISPNTPSSENLYMEGGGVAYSEGAVEKRHESLARGLTDEYDRMNQHSDQMKEAQKNTSARVKALETLMGIDKKKS